MAIISRPKPKRRPFKRVIYPSRPVDYYDIKYLDGGYQDQWGVGAQRLVDVEIREFDVYKNGRWIGRFDNSPRGLIDFAEAMK